MAKLHVVDPTDNTRVPFLRGILTRSLQDAGLSFEDAYEVASRMRDELSSESEIASEALRARVATALESRGPEVVQRYLRTPETGRILVRNANGDASSYSRGRHRLSLLRCGLTRDQVNSVAGQIYDGLVAQAVTEIESAELRGLTADALAEGVGAEAKRHYAVWGAFRESQRPLLVLIGGAPGCGKSTLGTQIAHVLDIVWVQSTDMLREVMRMTLPERLLPPLHESSFRAWRRLPVDPSADKNARMTAGYLAQKELVEHAQAAFLDGARGRSDPSDPLGAHSSGHGRDRGSADALRLEARSAATAATWPTRGTLVAISQAL
jgi:2-phosphoglycerate kinase